MRLNFSRLLLTFVTLWCLIIATTGFACSKSQLVLFAQDAVEAIKTARPYIAQLLPTMPSGSSENWAKVAAGVESLVKAIKDSDKQGALNILADITPAFNDLVVSLGGNVQVLSILAIADIAFHYLVNHIRVDNGVVNASPRLTKLMQYKTQRVWGCQYRPDYHPELKLCS